MLTRTFGSPPQRTAPARSARRAFANFDAFFTTRISPYLEMKEEARRNAVDGFRAIMIASLGGALFILVFSLGGRAKVEFALSMAGLGFTFASYLLHRARTDIQHGLLALIAEHCNFRYQGLAARPLACDRLRALKLLPEFNEERFEDEIEGEHEGIAFRFCEAELRMRRKIGKRKSSTTVFHGQIFELNCPAQFLGVTVLQRNFGPLNHFFKPSANFSRVGLASPEFERAFEAWSTDQVEARYLLDPMMLERFQALEKHYHGSHLRAAFADGRILLAMDTGDRLNIGTMFKPINERARVEAILDEIDALFDLIEFLVKRFDTTLAGPISLGDIRGAVSARA
jgi:hypothetical protein